MKHLCTAVTRLAFCLLLLLSFGIGASAQTIEVVASQSILADVTGVIGGESISLRTLIPRLADPHKYTPTPGDLAAIADSDLALIVGAGYEEMLLDAIQNAGESVHVVSASACIEIRPFGAGAEHEDEQAHEDDHADDHADDDHAHEDDHADDHADDEHADDEHEDDHADDDHADDHAEDEDAHEDDHADDEHEDDDADDDDHADDHADDDHADDHADDENADEEHDDDHADEEHEDDHADDEHDEDHGDMSDCDDHDAEVAAIVGDDGEDHAAIATLGREQDLTCFEGHEGDDHHDHAHGAGSCDPHVWMDPHLVIYWALQIRDALTELDPDNADAYAANAAAYAAELVAIESDFIQPMLEGLPADQRTMITSHGSMGYFATTFGFEIVTQVVASVGTAVEPSARDLAQVIDRIAEEGVPAIFTDAMASDIIMNTVAEESGVRLAPLYSDTLSEIDGPAGTYLDYIRYNTSTIIGALSQGG